MSHRRLWVSVPLGLLGLFAPLINVAVPNPSPFPDCRLLSPSPPPRCAFFFFFWSTLSSDSPPRLGNAPFITSNGTLALIYTLVTLVPVFRTIFDAIATVAFLVEFYKYRRRSMLQRSNFISEVMRESMCAHRVRQLLIETLLAEIQDLTYSVLFFVSYHAHIQPQDDTRHHGNGGRLRSGTLLVSQTTLLFSVFHVSRFLPYVPTLSLQRIPNQSQARNHARNYIAPFVDSQVFVGSQLIWLTVLQNNGDTGCQVHNGDS